MKRERLKIIVLLWMAFVTVSCVTKTLTSVEDTGKAIILKNAGRSVLQYNYDRTEPPEGVPELFGRNGYIHPVWSPEGNVLTEIQPPDHRHHYGIWNPWTRVAYDGKSYDLWNIGDGQGTVRAKGIDSVFADNNVCGFVADLEHVIFDSGSETVIIDEKWKVKTWNVKEGFMWDFESVLAPATDLPVLIEKYRYAGFGYRATKEWTRENCIMVTSEGKTRQEIDGTRARWIYITGATATGRSGLLFMAHPDNYNSPEPLRIWDENANGGRGDAFINFAPTKDMDWMLDAGETYCLRYRVLAYEGEMTEDTANRLWKVFAVGANDLSCRNKNKSQSVYTLQLLFLTLQLSF
ncbi:MAG: PmoA family protein [Dysgonamonadaceae bacterium]|jgi:hypothetical protein|nr:PmoA family protein [Dysgonamonadaceae bacterium]